MRDKRVRRVLALFAVGVLSLGSVLDLATAEAKQLVPYVLYDSNGQLLGLTTNFDEEFAVRDGRCRSARMRTEMCRFCFLRFYETTVNARCMPFL